MRIWHPWWLWECYAAGFYDTTCDVAPDDARRRYAAFLGDSSRFEAALERVLAEWPHSCEHFLSNASMNRIAWLGQAAACIAIGLPACYRAGFKLLTDAQQAAANDTARRALARWVAAREPAQACLPLCRDMARSRLSRRPTRHGAGGARAAKARAVVPRVGARDTSKRSWPIQLRLPAADVGLLLRPETLEEV